MANVLVNSLKRLYKSGKLTKEQVAERIAKGSITAADYEDITGEVLGDGE